MYLEVIGRGKTSPDTDRQTLHDSIYRMCLKWSNSPKKRTVWCIARDDGHMKSRLFNRDPLAVTLK